MLAVDFPLLEEAFNDSLDESLVIAEDTEFLTVVVDFHAFTEFISEEQWVLYLRFWNNFYVLANYEIKKCFYLVSDVGRCEIACKSIDIVGDFFFILFVFFLLSLD